MRVVIVGPCASGKTTLASALRQRGWDVAIPAQEHSAVAGLWRRSKPDLLVLLTAALETIRFRRGEAWPQAVYEVQLSRLANARAHADLVIDTGRMSVEDAVALIERRARKRQLGENDPNA